MTVSGDTMREARLMKAAMHGALVPFLRDYSFNANAFVGAAASLIGDIAAHIPVRKRRKMLDEINRAMRLATKGHRLEPRKERRS